MLAVNDSLFVRPLLDELVLPPYWHNVHRVYVDCSIGSVACKSTGYVLLPADAFVIRFSWSFPPPFLLDKVNMTCLSSNLSFSRISLGSCMLVCLIRIPFSCMCLITTRLTCLPVTFFGEQLLC